MFCFRERLAFFPPDMIYIYIYAYIIYRYIYTYLHIFFPSTFLKDFKIQTRKKSIGFTIWAPTSSKSSQQKPYTLPDKWRLLFFKIPPKKENQVEFFCCPPTERMGFAGGRKNPNDLSQTPGFHASFGSVVWGGGKFGGGYLVAPTAGPQWHRRSRSARHAREPTEKKSNKTMWQPFQIYCLKTKGH